MRSKSKDQTDQSEDQTDHSNAWLNEEDNLPIGGRHDTLMLRLEASLRDAAEKAHRNFRRHAAVRPPGNERERAVSLQKRTRRLLIVFAAAVALMIVGAADQRWPFLADAWELLTPWSARPWYYAATWPVGWQVAAGATALLGCLLVRLSARRLRAAVTRLTESEQRRQELAANTVHYASELLRLHNLIEQFTDHRRIITEMLHRPFGDPGHAAQGGLTAADVAFDEEPPASMVVTVANASDERVDAERRKFLEQKVNKGWLTSIYKDILRIWSNEYEQSVTTHNPDPDADTSSPRSPQPSLKNIPNRNPPREDFANAVALDGWALRQARQVEVQSLLDGGKSGGNNLENYLKLLEAPVTVHGPSRVAADVTEFFELGRVGGELYAGQVKHRFGWKDVLGPAAAGALPRVHAAGSGDSPTVASLEGDGPIVLMSWRLEYSQQVHASFLRGWTRTDHAVRAGPAEGVQVI